MNNYKVTGQSREAGAIGTHEPFIKNIIAISSQEAYYQARIIQYRDNRDHVLIKKIELVTDDYTVEIEPRAYL